MQYVMRLHNSSVVPGGIPWLIVHLHRLSMCHKSPFLYLSLLSTLALAMLVTILHRGHRLILISMCSTRGATALGITLILANGATRISGFHSSLAKLSTVTAAMSVAPQSCC